MVTKAGYNCNGCGEGIDLFNINNKNLNRYCIITHSLGSSYSSTSQQTARLAHVLHRDCVEELQARKIPFLCPCENPQNFSGYQALTREIVDKMIGERKVQANHRKKERDSNFSAPSLEAPQDLIVKALRRRNHLPIDEQIDQVKADLKQQGFILSPAEEAKIRQTYAHLLRNGPIRSSMVIDLPIEEQIAQLKADLEQQGRILSADEEANIRQTHAHLLRNAELEKEVKEFIEGLSFTSVDPSTLFPPLKEIFKAYKDSPDQHSSSAGQREGARAALAQAAGTLEEGERALLLATLKTQFPSFELFPKEDLIFNPETGDINTQKAAADFLDDLSQKLSSPLSDEKRVGLFPLIKNLFDVFPDTEKFGLPNPEQQLAKLDLLTYGYTLEDEERNVLNQLFSEDNLPIELLPPPTALQSSEKAKNLSPEKPLTPKAATGPGGEKDERGWFSRLYAGASSLLRRLWNFLCFWKSGS